MVALSVPPPPPHATAGPVALLASAVEALADDEPHVLPDAALGDDLVALRRHIDRLEAEFTRRLTIFDRRRGYASENAPTLTSWLRHTCRLSGGSAAQRVELARRLAELPETEAAYRTGEIGHQHATVIARCASEVGAERVREVEPHLIEAARRLDPGRLRFVTRHVRHCVDPDGALDATNDDHERRWLHLSQTFDGIFVLDGRLDAEGGAVVRTAIQALITPAHGDDERTPMQRRADALVELAARQLSTGTHPTAAGQRPHLTLTVSADTLHRTPGAPGADLAWAGPVHAETARRLACDASLTPIVTDVPDGTPLSRITADVTVTPLAVGDTRRTINPSLRRALTVRDRGCRFPGCDRPPEWTDGHHVRHWADHGPTRLDNLVLLCRYHHRRVHEGGWSVRWNPDGSLVTVPP